MNEDLKLELGLFLREAGNRWDSITLLAISQEYFNLHMKSTVDQGDLTEVKNNLVEDRLEDLIKKYSHLNYLIEMEGLRGVHIVKPILDGKDICSIYEIKPGKAIKFITEEQIKKQILNPAIKFDEMKDYLMENKDKFLKIYS